MFVCNIVGWCGEVDVTSCNGQANNANVMHPIVILHIYMNVESNVQSNGHHQCQFS